MAATGTSSDLTLDTLKDPHVREFVAGVEKSVAHYGDTALTFLTNLQRADDAGAALGYVGAVAVEEKSVVDYNEGNPTGDLETKGQHGKPKVPLVAVYPKEGTLNSDNPFAVLQAPWSDAGKQAGAKDFLAFLREPAQQELFTDAGFRSYDGRPGRAVSDSEYLREDIGVTLAPPSPPVLSSVRAAWSELRKPARVLLVLDVSGSMGQSAGGGVHEEDAAAAAVLGRREVVGDRAVRRRLDIAVGLGQDPEPVAHGGPGLGHRRLRRRDDLVGVVVMKRRVVAEGGEDPLEIVGADGGRAQLAVLAGQRFDLGQADVVDLLGAQPDRRVVADRRRVSLVAAGDPAQPGLVVGAGVWLDVVAERVTVRPGRRPDVALDDPGEAALPLLEVGAIHAAGVGGVEQRVLGERRREPAVDLLDGLADGEVGRGPAMGDTLAVPAGQVAEVRRDAVVLADEPLGDVGVGDRQLRDPDRQARLDAEDRVGAELVEVGPR